MTVGCGLVRGYAGLFLMRVGVGVGEAALSPPTYSLLSDYFHPERLARAMAIFSLGISIGGGMAYLVGGIVMWMVSKPATLVLPVLGAIRPWQATFIIVGLPGLLVALMMLGIREPPRRGGLLDLSGQVCRMPVSQVWRYLMDRWRLYISFPLGTALLGVFGYGMMAWYPTFLMRTHGMSIGEAGASFGLMYLVFGTAGTWCGARFAEILHRRGHRDGHMSLIMLAGIAMTVPGIIGPLLPRHQPRSRSPRSSREQLLRQLRAALQLVTPNQMRARFYSDIFGTSSA